MFTPSLASSRAFLMRNRWRLLGVLALWVAWLLFGRFALPGIVAPRIERAVTEATGHPTTLGALEFDPLGLAVTLRDLRIATPAGATVISVARIYVNFETRSLIDRAWNFSALEIDEPFVNAELRADGSLNLTDLAGPPTNAPASAPAQSAPPATLPRLIVQNFSFRGGRIDFIDQGLTPPFATSFANLALSLTDFSTLPNDRGVYALQAHGPTGGLFVWRGTLGVNPVGSEGSFTLEGFSLPAAFGLVGERFAYDISDGTMRASIPYTVSDTAHGLAFKIAGAEASLEHLEFGARDSAPLVTLPKLVVSGVDVDVNARKVAVAEVRLDQLGVTLARDAAGIDLLQLLSAAPPTAAAAPPTAAAAPTRKAEPAVAAAPAAAPNPVAANAAPWRVSLARFALVDAKVALTDRTLPMPGTVTVAPLDLAVTDVLLGAETRFTVALDAVIDGVGKLHVTGPLTGTVPAGTLAIKLDGLALAPFQPWVDPIAHIELASGTVSADAKLTLSPSAPPTAPSAPVGRHTKKPVPAAAAPAQRIVGYAEVSDLKVRDAHLKQDLLRWKRLQLRGFDVALGPERIRIDEIVAEQPYLRFLIGADGTTNLQGLTGAAPQPAANAPMVATTTVPASSKPAPAAAPALPIEINRVRVIDGSANFADQSLTPVFATGIQQLSGSIVGLSSQQMRRAEVTLDGKVDKYAPVKIRGAFNLLAAESFTDVSMSFHDIELTTFTPYAGKFAGYTIDKGRLSLDIRYQLENRHLKGDHKIVLDQLTLGERVDSADAMSLPIKLALALLKDSRGVIDLDLPIEGSLDDPQFRYGPIVWQAVTTVLVKIVTAPFALLGNLFGGGADLSQVEFAAGATALDAKALAQLDSLAKGLTERPALRLDVRGVAAPAADGALLARWRVLDTLRPDGTARELAVLTPKEQKQLLALHTQRFGADPTVAGLAPDAKPTPAQLHEAALDALASADGPAPEALRQLAQARAAAVKDYLVTRGMVPAERVFLLEAETTTTAAPGNPVAIALVLGAD